ncbi:hypothetical protein D3P08_00725 [Paenibacillus nanensis]|uniref:VCBS repeat-containing protein n=1 Tax=Paenibacillus nanensis TaxID=393251 RepID=A0A3A1VNP0_9BACL|nr:hypothetical protein [Paenibacillus nanensis]RIX60143.1 hypothetical protein D3P08_00725 [Paenibacillus nanensis]
MHFGRRALFGLWITAMLLGGCQSASNTVDKQVSGNAEENNAQESVESVAGKETAEDKKDGPEEEAEPSSEDSVIAGEVIEEQSFSAVLEPAGQFAFIASQELSAEGFPTYHFYLKNEQGKLTELTYSIYDWELPGPADLKAVAFRDVNQDGKKDILVIIDRITGAGKMGAIPYSTVVTFTQQEAGFTYDAAIVEAIKEANIYRQITVDQVMALAESGFASNADQAWASLAPGVYELEGSNEWAGSVIEIKNRRADQISLNLDAFSVRGGEEGLKQGNVNLGELSGEAFRSEGDMVFKDESFELWLSLISPNELYVWDNGEPYFGAGVYVGGIYALKKD